MKPYTQKLLIITCIGLGLLSCTAEDKSPSAKKPPTLVEVEKVQDSNQNLSTTRTGSLRARREVKVFNQEEGQITQLPFFEGDSVKQGDVVVKLNDEIIKAQYRRARAIRIKAAQDLKRTRKIYKEKLISNEQLLASETAFSVAKADEALYAARLRYTTIEAPISGIVSKRLTEPGNIAERYTHLLTITDPSSLVTELSLSELLMAKLEKDQTVSVRVDALGKNQFSGRIARIHPNLDPVTRRGTVEVEINPVPEGARPGQLCRVELPISSEQRMTIAFRALRRDKDAEYVYVVDENKKVQQVWVTTGVRLGERVEVTHGLTAGQLVVIKGFLNLSPGKVVAIVNQNQSKNAPAEVKKLVETLE